MKNEEQVDEVRLRAMLVEDLGDEAEAFREVGQKMSQWTAPQVDDAMRTRLITRLATENQTQLANPAQRLVDWWPLLLLRSQIKVVHGEIWLASLLLIVLGTLVTLASSGGNAQETLPMVVLAPVVSVFGVTLLYDERAIKMLELESTTAVSARLLLLARLTLVYGFNLLLMLIGSVSLSLLRDDLSLWPLVMSWFAPMTFLSALAFFASVLFVDAIAGGLLGLGLWMVHVILRYAPIENIVVNIASMPGLSANENRPLLFLAAIMLTAVALWLAGLHERLEGGMN